MAHGQSKGSCDMDSLDKKIIGGITIAAVTTVILYALLASMQEKDPGAIGREVIDACRNLTRESADILVQVARDNLKPDNPDDVQRLAALESRIVEIEGEMERLDCYETREQWAYGSFRQEMSEYETYIAELVRQNTET